MNMAPDFPLSAIAGQAGFDWAVWLDAGPTPRGDVFRQWLADGFEGGMVWMKRSAEARLDPRTYRPGTRSLILAAAGYGVEEPPPAIWEDPARGRVARFAWGPDYHTVLDERLRDLAARLEAAGPLRVLARFSDSRPVLERAWASAGGAGCGKNAQCLLPGLGSHVLLGGLLLDAPCPTPPPVPPPDPCGPCDACLRACPGGALVAPGRLDARLCLSYWTLEHPGVIPPGPAYRMGRWLAGCDMCQEVCPHVRNRAPACRAPFLRFVPERDAPRLDDVLNLSPEGFHARYAGTPLERLGLSRFRRNAVVALARSDDPGSARALELAARDADPLVAEQARQERVARA
jgi:epoxyqueuosine reductase